MGVVHTLAVGSNTSRVLLARSPGRSPPRSSAYGTRFTSLAASPTGWVWGGRLVHLQNIIQDTRRGVVPHLHAVQTCSIAGYLFDSNNVKPLWHLSEPHVPLTHWAVS